MSFASPAFLAFVAAVVAAAVAAGPRWRVAVLLPASYAFYAACAGPLLLTALAAETALAWVCGLAMERERRPRRRRLLLALGVGGSLAIMATLRLVADLRLPVGGGVLQAIGVSYYSLQAMAYLVDVRDGVLQAERSPWRFALFLALFPKLVQGPIERGGALLPQLREPAPLRAQDVAAGAERFLWGLFQKVVVADGLAPFVAAVYDDLPHHSGLQVLVATYLFAAQIYLDFAGYTDMALGVGRALGVQLTPNFDAPYLSPSVAEFWRRWHISFSSWLLDYIFRPLQLGLRGWRTWGTPAAILVTFALSGLWHGASANFVAWGVLHGLYLGGTMLRRALRPAARRRPPATRLRQVLRVVATFHLVCLAWVFFRAASITDALGALHGVATGLPAGLRSLISADGLRAAVDLDQGPGRGALLLALAALVASAGMRAWFRRLRVAPRLGDEAPPAAWTWPRTLVSALAVYLVVVVGAAVQSFLYARY